MRTEAEPDQNVELNQTWKAEAACGDLIQDVDVETLDAMFHPGQNSSHLTRYAVNRYCNQCPVTSECLDFALATGSTGIWGGYRVGRYVDTGQMHVKEVGLK